MTIDDRDLERALTALADDGYPASSNVDRSYLEFLARASRAEQRRRTTRVVVAAGVAGILGIGGLLAYQQARGGQGRDELQPATPTTSTAALISQQDLEGIWAVEADWLYSGFPWLWTFNPDGSASGSPHADTTDNTWVYTLSGNNIGARDRPGSCQYSWRVASFDQGAMTFDVLVHCGNTGPGIALTRLSPASPAGIAIAMTPMTDATAPTEVADVGGVWLMQGTGMLLAIEARDPGRATYRLDDKGALARHPIDQGTITLDPSGTLTLTSTQPTPTGCTAEQGARIALKGVLITEQGLDARQGVETDCVDANLTSQWIRVAAP